MIKIRGTKRRGSLIADALVAFVILALIIIPVSAAITFSYHSIASSAEISKHANKFYDRIDNTILENSINPAAAFAGWVPAGSGPYFISKNPDGTGPSINVSLISYSDIFTAGGKRKVSVDVYMIMQ